MIARKYFYRMYTLIYNKYNTSIFYITIITLLLDAMATLRDDVPHNCKYNVQVHLAA